MSLEDKIKATAVALDKLHELWYTERAKLPLHMRRDVAAVVLGLKEQELFWQCKPSVYGYQFGFLADGTVPIYFSNEPSEFRVLCKPYKYE